ncbi:FAD-binding protein [Lentzea sp. NEAU-D13]|uniref:FAD-binding protein n=1 Tax=Lentzea alba TaxID=2714351 RepID=A0A7C9W3S3_9PSEU|nr:FAD/NAD(P)-binding protein [Lentzea alba]NGY64157.1 FAD-binding protein [Lentzea alba]
MGPRGLSVLERMCANWLPAVLGDELVVHVVDPAEHGSGNVWNTRQSSGFLMNTVCSQVTVFPDDSVRMEGPVRRGPSLYEWSRSVASTASLDDGNDTIRSEARRLGPDSYATRAFYGHYLVWALKEIARTAPVGVRIVHHRQLAVDVTENETGHAVRLADGQVLDRLGAVVLAQGHLPSRLGVRERELTEFAAARGLRYVAPGNPADADLTSVEPDEPTLLLGLGLNFFDHLAVLTTGRGGRFERSDGVLVYHPSGSEPRLYAGSRRGVPLHARGENQKGAHGRHQAAVLTEDVVAALRSAPVDFRAHLWPLIAKEVETVYYATELASLGPARVAEFSSRYRSCAPGPEEAALLDEYGVAEGARWDWTRVENPVDRLGFTSIEEFRPWLLTHLREDVARAAEGNVRGPVKAALDVLRDLRNEIRAVVDHGGLRGRSHRDDLEHWFSPLNAFLSIGPPARRIEEMAALISAGVLDVLGPGTRVEAVEDSFFAVADLMPQPLPVRVVIDARMPTPDVRTTDDSLLRRLLAAGRCRPHRVPDGEGGVLETGGLDVTPRPARVIAADGAPNPGLYALGVPTESVHWATAVGIRPCSASATVGDADAIARAALGSRCVPRRGREGAGRAM